MSLVGISVGCGQRPTEGWRNFDNSPSLRLAAVPGLAAVLRAAGLLDEGQWSYIAFARAHAIEYADATRRLPVGDACADVVYSSHMLEHLDRLEAGLFLAEARRVLRPGGILRLVIPDLRKLHDAYHRSGDAAAFMEASLLAVPRPRTLAGRLRLLLTGPRHHQWMYDGPALVRLLEAHGFAGAKLLAAGETTLANPGGLDLHEKADESVYCEAVKR